MPAGTAWIASDENRAAGYPLAGTRSRNADMFKTAQAEHMGGGSGAWRSKYLFFITSLLFNGQDLPHRG
jgi:hypothetical protein